MGSGVSDPDLQTLTRRTHCPQKALPAAARAFPESCLRKVRKNQSDKGCCSVVLSQVDAEAPSLGSHPFVLSHCWLGTVVGAEHFCGDCRVTLGTIAGKNSAAPLVSWFCKSVEVREEARVPREQQIEAEAAVVARIGAVQGVEAPLGGNLAPQG